jgi:hypothetical protein
MKRFTIIYIFYILLWVLGSIGEIRCIVKMIQCNWESIGKAEVIYTVGTFTGTGCIIGWINIEDK